MFSALAACHISYRHIHISLGHPYCMIRSRLTVTFGLLPGLLLSIFQCKISVVWFIVSQMYSFGHFPSGSLESLGGSVGGKHSESPVMSLDLSFMMLLLTPHGEQGLPDHYFPTEAAPCNSIWEASCSSLLCGIQMNLFEFHGGEIYS